MPIKKRWLEVEINISGPRVLFELPILGGIKITQTVVNGWIVVLSISIVCFVLTKSLVTRNPSKRQIAAEKLYSMINNTVESVMGEGWIGFAPYVAALFSYSMIGSLVSIAGLRSVTGDLSTTAAMAAATTTMVIGESIRSKGIGGWIKSYSEPVAVITPLNIISEFANPVSMAFRHFGNVAAGIIITNILYAALAMMSSAVLGFLPNGIIKAIPIFQFGIPAVLSIYFDLFTAFLQAYIISMLTMVNVSGAR